MNLVQTVLPQKKSNGWGLQRTMAEMDYLQAPNFYVDKIISLSSIFERLIDDADSNYSIFHDYTKVNNLFHQKYKVLPTRFSLDLGQILQPLETVVVMNRDDAQSYLVSTGKLDAVLDICSYVFSEGIISKLSETSKEDILRSFEVYSNDESKSLALAYRPIFEGQKNLKEATGPHLEELKDCIFLGLVFFQSSPPKSLVKTIDQLKACGIRFVFFSPFSETKTKSIARGLDIETDWNSCINLSIFPGQDPHSKDKMAFTDPKSRLPRGVHNVRSHLEHVDDIPLHISLFAESRIETIIEMLSIYGENSEKVVCVGSTLKWDNAFVFNGSYFSIGIEPVALREASDLFVSSKITSLSCQITLPPNIDPQVFFEIIMKSRTLYQRRAILLSMMENTSLFTITTCLCVRSTDTMSVFFLLNGLFLILIIISTVSLSTSPQIHFQMPKKAFWDTKSHKYLFWLKKMIDIGMMAFFHRLKLQELQSFSYALLNASIASSYFYEHESLLNFGVRNNPFWPCSALLTLLFCFLNDVWRSQTHSSPLALLFELAKASLWAILNVVLHEMIKIYLRLEFERTQKLSRLIFNTRLGMHSPI